MLTRIEHPIVQAPLAGGPSTPELAAAVCEAGGLGFLAAGYKTRDAVAADIESLRALTDRPFGVNLFAPPTGVADAAAVAAYAATLPEPLGEPRRDDDGWQAKLELVQSARVAVVSVAFGCPDRDVVDALHEADCAVWVTVTRVDEAVQARAAGADALVVQGVEAGGHRGSFDDRAPGDLGTDCLAAARGRRGRPAARRHRRDRDRPRRSRRAGRRCDRRATRNRVHARARGRDVAGAPRRDQRATRRRR